ncbi:MAG: SsrA-binding protein SmpB [Candidatus Paceibacterota bacterium]
MESIQNRKARMEYEILETYQAGLVLSGGEVKSIRTGKASLLGSYIKVYGDEAWLVNAHITPYQEKNTTSEYDPLHARKLLLHKKEIGELLEKTREKGFSLIPLQIREKSGRIKVEVALARGKKQRDKRETIKKRETKRDIDRFTKSR